MRDTGKGVRGILFDICALVLSLTAACGTALEDNGTHLAHVLENGSGKLRHSGARELVVRYTTLDGADEPYYVEITPSFPSGTATTVPGSYLVVSGKTSGGTSYHNRFVLVPERFYVEKPTGGATEVSLRRDGDRIIIVGVR